MSLAKKPEETIKDYKIRLFRNKELYDLSSRDIAKYINDASNSSKDESAYRKWFSAYDEGYTDAMEYVENDSAISKELIQKKIDIEVARKKLQAEKTEVNKWYREVSQKELFHEKIYESLKESFHDFKLDVTPITKSYNKKDTVLCLSDQHYGVDFKVYGLKGEVINEYSPEIFEQRMEFILGETIKYILKEDIDTLHIMSLGDTLDGFLRNSQLATLRWGVTDCIINFSKYMFKWLTELSKHVNINFYHTFGNHTELRLLDGKKNEHKDENIDKVFLNTLKMGIELTNNQNINIIENKSGYIYYELPTGFNIFGCHGEFKNMEKAFKDLETVYNVNIDYLFGGHLHNFDYTTVGVRKGCIRVGSIIGCDDFSLSILKNSDATANILTFEEGYGLVNNKTIVLN